MSLMTFAHVRCPSRLSLSRQQRKKKNIFQPCRCFVRRCPTRCRWLRWLRCLPRPKRSYLPCGQWRIRCPCSRCMACRCSQRCLSKAEEGNEFLFRKFSKNGKTSLLRFRISFTSFTSFTFQFDHYRLRLTCWACLTVSPQTFRLCFARSHQSSRWDRVSVRTTKWCQDTLSPLPKNLITSQWTTHTHCS